MSKEDEELAKLCEIYDFTSYDFGPASDNVIASCMAFPERYKKTSANDDAG
jgi:hypothetical protein